MSKKKRKSSEEIQFENELIKLKMNAESGTKIFMSEEHQQYPS